MKHPAPAYVRKKSRSNLDVNEKDNDGQMKRGNSRNRIITSDNNSSYKKDEYSKYLSKQKEKHLDLIGRYEKPLKDQLQKKRDEAKKKLQKAYRSRVSSAEVDRDDPKNYYYNYRDRVRPVWY